MDLFSTHVKRWIEENQSYFQPPLKTNRLLMSQKDFLVMILRGPNTRLDFHVDPGDEFFYQVRGDMELHVKPDNERRQVVKISEGDIFVCPGGLPHSPRRFENTWGLVIERRRREEEREQFVWFCERCDERVFFRVLKPQGIASQVAAVYKKFNGTKALRTCRKCGYVFPETPLAERLGFLDGNQSF